MITSYPKLINEKFSLENKTMAYSLHLTEAIHLHHAIVNISGTSGNLIFQRLNRKVEEEISLQIHYFLYNAAKLYLSKYKYSVIDSWYNINNKPSSWSICYRSKYQPSCQLQLRKTVQQVDLVIILSFQMRYATISTTRYHQDQSAIWATVINQPSEQQWLIRVTSKPMGDLEARRSWSSTIISTFHDNLSLTSATTLFQITYKDKSLGSSSWCILINNQIMGDLEAL